VLDAELRYIHAGGGTSTSQAEETHSFRICHPKKGSAMVDPVTSAAPAGATPAAVTPAAMTEEQLTEAIESTLAAAHLACQPYFLALAELWLPGVKMERTESSIVWRWPSCGCRGSRWRGPKARSSPCRSAPMRRSKKTGRRSQVAAQADRRRSRR
jgi:hypothetical protein